MEEAAKKVNNAARRAEKKEAQARLEEEWTSLKAVHEAETKAWKLACDALKEQRVAKKNWPKAPVRPKKPKLPSNVVDTGEDELEEEIDEDNDDVDA